MLFILSLLTINVALASTDLPYLISLYQSLHENPELSHHEETTSKRLASELKDLGLEVTTNVGGFGVVGLLKNGTGKTVMVRTDLDALPIEEQTGLKYASKKKGVMHACGHDIHMTTWVGVARHLSRHKENWQGTVMFVGQPAEERGAGARAMLDAGLFTKFSKPDYALAWHVAGSMRVGDVGIGSGYITATADSVDIEVLGKGGHGALPQHTIDPVVLASKIVLDLQTIASREVGPSDPVVVTVGSIHGGTKHNIIPDSVKLQLTVRTFSSKSREKVFTSIKRIANGAAASMGAPAPKIKFDSEPTLSLYNDPKLAATLTPVLERLLGSAHLKKTEPQMIAEDFSMYGRAGVPSAMLNLGSVTNTKDAPSLHSARYYPDPEPTLATGVSVMSELVMFLLKPKKLT